MDFVSYIPAIILLILGFGLVVLEMYLPGFGAPGILGCILLVAGVVAARPTPLQALIMALIIVALCASRFRSSYTRPPRGGWRTRSWCSKKWPPGRRAKTN